MWLILKALREVLRLSLKRLLGASWERLYHPADQQTKVSLEVGGLVFDVYDLPSRIMTRKYFLDAFQAC